MNALRTGTTSFMSAQTSGPADMPAAPLSSDTAAAAAGPIQADKGESESKGWEFASSAEDKNELPSGGIGFMLGMGNANDAQHGAEFTQMMAKLKPLAVAKGNRWHLGDMGFDAAAGNAYDSAIEGMTAYRDKLASEKGRYRERHRQIALLDQFITAATHDKEKNAARMTTTLPGQEFTQTIHGGGINQVYRFSRNDEGAYFKPRQEESGDVEKSVMQRVGIRPAEAAADGNPGYDPHLANREIAFSRLGNMLGVDVTLGAKKAVLGKDVPTGQKFGSRTFKAKPGTTGLVMGEAKGDSWRGYDWDYYSPDMSVDKKAKSYEDITYGGNGASDRNLGDRLREKGLRLKKKSTTDTGFQGVDGMPIFSTPSYKGGKGKKRIDTANSDFQRQMNQLFLLDTLAAQTDRHGGNFMVDMDEHDKVSIRAIDNDLTFGALADTQADMNAFGKRGGSFNYGGLPARMQIDADMAKKIRGMTKQMLDTAFSDLLEPREIDALWTRFQMMKKYIQAQADEDPSRIVSVWDEETARREVSLAGGVESYKKEDKTASGSGFSGNSYSQRHMLMLRAAEIGNEILWAGAHGR